MWRKITLLHEYLRLHKVHSDNWILNMSDNYKSYSIEMKYEDPSEAFHKGRPLFSNQKRFFFRITILSIGI